MFGGGGESVERADEESVVGFVVVVGSDETASLVTRATDDTVRISRQPAVEDVATGIAEPVDCVVVDETTAWGSLVTDDPPSVPMILVADRETPVEKALDAGVTDCVRRDDPAAARMLDRRLSNALTSVSERADRVRKREWLETLLRHSTDSMSVVDENGTALYNSPSVEDQLGYSPAELRGQNMLEHVHPADRDDVQGALATVVNGADGEYETATYRRRHADGSWRWIEAVGTAKFDDPQVGGLVLNRRDVTERERQRRQLRDQEAYVESLLDAQPDVFYVLDADGFFREWNARLTEVLGYDDAEIDEMHAVETIVPEDREMIMSAMTTVYQAETPEQRESEFLTADGERIPYQLNGAPLTDSDGEVIGLVGTGRDISERVRREERLSVLNRVLRHNLRNRTNVVIGHAEQLAATANDSNVIERAETIRDVGRDLDRLGVLARKVDHALEGQTDPVTMPVERILTRAESAVPEAAQFTVADPPGTTVSVLDSIPDAVAELVDNAARHTPHDEPRIDVTVSVEPEHATLHIADDGDGIPDHEITALEDGETRLQHGGGLGLWFVNWVVEASGGTLSFDESEFGGTRVSVRLPRVTE